MNDMDHRIEIEHLQPEDIERRSFEIITAELKGRVLSCENEAVIKRVIHTTADFDYLDNLVFSSGAAAAGIAAIESGAAIVTDTQMARAGVNKARLGAFGGECLCFMGECDVAQEAKARGITRAAVSMERAAALEGAQIVAIGNAPTALIRLCELIQEGRCLPKLVIGAPVGFVNVTASKELLLEADVPYIAAMGRKGGSTVAAAICNALIYQARV